MKRIVYFCPVDWRWIKQRPQFLAEGLQKYGNVTAIYPWKNRRKDLQNKAPSTVKLQPYFTLPSLGGRVPLMDRVNRLLSRVQISLMIGPEKPDILWLTMPWQIELTPARLECPIIYDCMDDYVAIHMQEGCQTKIQEQERELIQRASLIFVSSQHLLTLLEERYCVEPGKLYLLRNGYSAEWPKCSQQETRPGERLKIGYFGTIGRWFDFETVLESLSACENVEYHLYGPTEDGVVIPRHERIAVHGVVEHHQIPVCAVALDALVMPFVPDEIVQSVDPVKLYEYVHLNKHILCIRYPEIERFEPFVEFYDAKEAYIKQLRRLLNEKPEVKYTPQQAEAFLKENSWAMRAECAARQIESLMTRKR